MHDAMICEVAGGDPEERSALVEMLDRHGFCGVSRDLTRDFVKPCDVILLSASDGSPAAIGWLKGFRAQGDQSPVVVLADDAGLRVTALRAGADDAVPTGTSAIELVMRLRAVVRRAAIPNVSGDTAEGPFRIDADRRRVVLGAREATLTDTQLRIVDLLHRHGEDDPMPLERLHAAIYQTQHRAAGANNVRVLIAQIRRRLADGFGDSVSIGIRRGEGYFMSWAA